MIDYQYVIDLFESNFQDKDIIPESLERIWFKRAVGRYSFEIQELFYDEEIQELDTDDPIVADTLALYMLLFYAERNKSKVNKRSQIVTKDISLNGGGSIYSATKNEYDDILSRLEDLISKQKHPALSEGSRE